MKIATFDNDARTCLAAVWLDELTRLMGLTRGDVVLVTQNRRSIRSEIKIDAGL